MENPSGAASYETELRLEVQYTDRTECCPEAKRRAITLQRVINISVASGSQPLPVTVAEAATGLTPMGSESGAESGVKLR